MPEATIGVIVKPLGSGLWDVTAFGYLNEGTLGNRITEGGWVELWEVPGWGAPNKLVVGPTDLLSQGQIYLNGLLGSDSDEVIWMRNYWLVMHYQAGHPGTPRGPEYRVTHQFGLGYNFWSDGVDTPTEIVPSAAVRARAIAEPLRAAVPAAGPILLGSGLLFLALRK